MPNLFNKQAQIHISCMCALFLLKTSQNTQVGKNIISHCNCNKLIRIMNPFRSKKPAMKYLDISPIGDKIS